MTPPVPKKVPVPEVIPVTPQVPVPEVIPVTPLIPGSTEEKESQEKIRMTTMKEQQDLYEMFMGILNSKPPITQLYNQIMTDKRLLPETRIDVLKKIFRLTNYQAGIIDLNSTIKSLKQYKLTYDRITKEYIDRNGRLRTGASPLFSIKYIPQKEIPDQIDQLFHSLDSEKKLIIGKIFDKRVELDVANDVIKELNLRNK